MMMATLSMGRAVSAWGYTVGALTFLYLHIFIFVFYIYTAYY